MKGVFEIGVALGASRRPLGHGAAAARALEHATDRRAGWAMTEGGSGATYRTRKKPPQRAAADTPN